MYFWALLAAMWGLYGGDEQHLALTTKAESAFDRVHMAAVPELRDAAACVQAEAALLPVTAPEDMPLAHFRKGYCTVAEATITHGAAEFLEAAGEFDKAMGAWAARTGGKDKPAEPVSSGLLVLAAIARLHAGPDAAAKELARNQVAAAAASPVCPSTVMPAALCQAILRTGHEWLGWFALEAGRLGDAAREFAAAPEGSGWGLWLEGRTAFEKGDFREAAARYGRAIGVLHPEAAASLLAGLGPPADRGQELVELGGAQLLAGDATAAIATLDAALKAAPAEPRAFYLRARARELAGQGEAALADYNLASRTAFAEAQDLASGEAHLYRGILFYRRKDYPHAEDEFASALNFEIPAGMRADAVAWRHLAAVSGGSCGASHQLLERSLAAVSPYFPRVEARAALAGCPADTAAK